MNALLHCWCICFVETRSSVKIGPRQEQQNPPTGRRETRRQRWRRLEGATAPTVTATRSATTWTTTPNTLSRRFHEMTNTTSTVRPEDNTKARNNCLSEKGGPSDLASQGGKNQRVLHRPCATKLHFRCPPPSTCGVVKKQPTCILTLWRDCSSAASSGSSLSSPSLSRSGSTIASTCTERGCHDEGQE